MHSVGVSITGFIVLDIDYYMSMFGGLSSYRIPYLPIDIYVSFIFRCVKETVISLFSLS